MAKRPNDAEQSENFTSTNRREYKAFTLRSAVMLLFNLHLSHSRAIGVFVGRFPSFSPTGPLSMFRLLSRLRNSHELYAWYKRRDSHQASLRVCVCVGLFEDFQWMNLMVFVVWTHSFPYQSLSIGPSDNTLSRHFLLIFFAFIVNSVYYYCSKWEKHVFHTTFFWEIFSWNSEGLSQQNGIILDWCFHLLRLALAESQFMFVN